MVKLLICDEAGQYKAVTEKWAACWVYDGRHYKKLITPISLFQQEVEEFLDAWPSLSLTRPLKNDKCH